MKWFRLYDEVLDDPKVQKLHPALFKHWINLLCLSSQQKDRGTLPSMEVVAFRLRVRMTDAEHIVEQLTAVGLLEVCESGATQHHNWTERQKVSDDIAARVRKHRSGTIDKEGANQEPRVTLPETLPPARGNALDTDTDTEKISPPLAPTKAPGKPARAALVPVVAKPNKYGDFIDAVHAQDLPYESDPADARAVVRAAQSAAQIAECYGALARGEWGDDWTRGRLSAQTAVKYWNAYQTAKTVPKDERRGRNGKRDAFGELAEEIERLEQTRNGRHHDHGPTATADDPFDGLLTTGGTNGTARPGHLPEGHRQVVGELPYKRLA